MHLEILKQVSSQVACTTRNADVSAVFGVDLETLLKRESPDGEIAPGAIPSVIVRLIEVVEARGLTEVGICKLPFHYDW